MDAKRLPLAGILAGMGPKSTGPFVSHLVDKYQTITGAVHDIEFPPMMVYALPTPFYVDRSIDHEQMQKVLIDGLKKLEACGVDFIAIPCNTAHQYFDELQKAIHVPLLNIVDITTKAIPQSAKNLAIIGTKSTVESNIFQKQLGRKKLSYLVKPELQDLVDKMLIEIKSKKQSSKLMQAWNQLASELHENNIDTILLACTDLNLIFDQMALPFQLVDASDCLAQAIVDKWLERQGHAVEG